MLVQRTKCLKFCFTVLASVLEIQSIIVTASISSSKSLSSRIKGSNRKTSSEHETKTDVRPRYIKNGEFVLVVM